MADDRNDQKFFDYLKRVTVDLHDARRRLREAEEREQEAIAIVGMSCRYPGGVRSPEELWQLAASGGDAISSFPTNRGWDPQALYDPDPDSYGTSYANEGGFVHDAGGFDAGFFGISPREALAMDPQQRMLLEVSWELCEDAGLRPSSLKGTQTGVFVGVSSQDYALLARSLPPELEGYFVTSNFTSVVSGRVAYIFGLEGPALTVDTACSSSLVALHLACDSLRKGECSLALAGGVCLMSTPFGFVVFSRQRGLAPDGRCKSYADAADGIGLAEGAGLLMLERLSDAQRLGHRVLAVIRGSAVNQDGASNGLSAPNGPSQQRLIVRALANARLATGDVDVVEGHGTGTVLGDPIEAQALLATYGQGRGARPPLWLGSVKSNIGHSHAAAGVAGVIKTVMSMRHELLPRTLHIDQPSTHVNWSLGDVALLTQDVLWAPNGTPRRAGVSSFGISGTNAHMILEEAPSAPVRAANGTEPLARPADADGGNGGTATDNRATGDETVDHGAAGNEAAVIRPLGDGVLPWVLSGRGWAGLRGQAARLAEYVQQRPELAAPDVGRSLAARPLLEHRALVLGNGRDDLLRGLAALAEARVAPGVVEGRVAPSRNPVFVFPGQGGQWPGMALDLLDESPVFAQALRACAEALGGLVDWSLEDVLRGIDGAPGLERVDVVQPALFAVMVALAGLWRACGVVPGAVVGHSQGEIAAVHVAGGLSLRDASRLVVARSRALVGLMGRGGMVSVALPESELGAWLAPRHGSVSLAAVNGPTSVVVSGERQALDQLLSELQAAGVRAREIAVGYASHSAQIEEVREELLEACVGITPQAGEVPFHSTLTGEVLDTAQLDGEYWYRNLRETVRFEPVIRSLLHDDHRAFLEIGPHPVLSMSVQDIADDVLAHESDSVLITGTLRRDAGARERFLTSLGEAWVRGVDVDWTLIFDGSGAQRVSLPGYAFQREHLWLQARDDAGDASLIGLQRTEHPLLGAAVEHAGGSGDLFTGRLSLSDSPWLADHAVMGAVLLPGTAFLEMALHAGTQVGCPVVQELVLQAPLVLSEDAPVQLQLILGAPQESGARSLEVYSRLQPAAGEDRHDAARHLPGTAEGGDSPEHAWTRHAQGTLVPASEIQGASMPLLAGAGSTSTGPSPSFPSPLADFALWPPAGAESVVVDGLYERLAEWGIEFGPTFQGLIGVWMRGEDLFAEVSLPEGERRRAGEFGVHPALLDAAFHALGTGLLDTDAQQGSIGLPFSWGGVSLGTLGAASLRVRLTRQASGEVSLLAVDDAGLPAVSIESLVVRPVSAEQLAQAQAGRGVRDSLLSLEWVGVSPAVPAVGVGSEWVVLGDGEGVLAGGLRGSGVSVEAFGGCGSLGEALDGGLALPPIVLLDCAGGPVDGVAREEAPGGDGALGAGFEAGLVAGSGVGLPASVRGAVGGVLGVVQAWLGDERFAASCLVVVTRGAVAAGPADGVDGLGLSGVWGLVRSAQSENPGRLVLVDVDGGEASWGALAGVVGLEEPQVALRGGGLLVPRLARGALGGTLVPPANSLWRLSASGGGTLDGLGLVDAPEVGGPLVAGQVRVGVRAAGLNFRDVLIALGVYPGVGVLGGEGAGVVLEVGPGVEGLGVGERVMGMFGGFGPVAVAGRSFVVPVPEGWSFARAASVPAVFLTAFYGLVDLAGLRGGERVLVHAGAGGVGMAAVQLAQHLGAEVFATASPGKWGALRELGLDDAHIASSRSLEFRERFLEVTGGEGVDVVLDSLAREFVDASLELLPRGGRFVEMGKTDIRDAGEVGEAYPGVAYRAFELIEAGAERIQEMLLEILALFERGVLRGLPVRAWDIRCAPDAFRYVSQARHVGKNVLMLPASIGAGGTVLITGGTGQLGGLLARHLVRAHGVGSVLLASRRGPEAEGARALEAELTELGAMVTLAACDVGSREELRVLLDRVPEEFPLTAVVHAAGVLDDGVIDALTPERLDRVMGPKVDAAWHLHELTQHLDLEAFVLFSAAAGVLGSPGQGNYAAANAFLDALAGYRRARGLAASSLAWGWWEDVSAMTGHLGDTDLARLERMGATPISAERGMELFDAGHATAQALMLPLPLDTQPLRAAAAAGMLPPILSNLIRGSRRRTDAALTGALARRLTGAPSEEHEKLVLEAVRSQIAAVLGHASPETIDPQLAFKDLGFDSLTAVELRNRLNAITGLRLPATLIFDHPTLVVLTRHVLAELQGVRSATATAVRATRPLEEPIAIVGMSCRLPGGVRSAQELWELLIGGGEGIGGLPPDRGWDLERLFDPDPDQAGTSYARAGGFLYDAGEFDADFFGINRREALAMDPQQRLLLEASWEALEDAGIAPATLRCSPTGVFAGVSSQDYTSLLRGAIPEGLEGYLSTGASTSVVSGRVAYSFGFEGPALTVDTACSSSLVALHLACQALRSGECSLALASGVDRAVLADRIHRVLAVSAASRRTGAASPSPRPPTASVSPRALVCLCSSASPTRGASDTKCSVSCGAAPSTRTEPATG